MFRLRHLPQRSSLPVAVPSLILAKGKKLNPLFSYPSTPSKNQCLPKPFAIRRFRTLLQNTPGGTPFGPSSFNFKLSTVNRISLSSLPNSHGITSFAHPYTLTPIESYSCKKQGEGFPVTQAEGEEPHVPARHAEIRATPIPPWVYFITRGHPGSGPYFLGALRSPDPAGATLRYPFPFFDCSPRAEAKRSAVSTQLHSGRLHNAYSPKMLK